MFGPGDLHAAVGSGSMTTVEVVVEPPVVIVVVPNNAFKNDIVVVLDCATVVVQGPVEVVVDAKLIVVKTNGVVCRIFSSP